MKAKYSQARKKFVLLTTIFILLVLSVPQIYSQTAATDKGKIYLWKISAGHNNVYLLGSIHVMKKMDYPLDERMEQAFEKSDAVVLEADIDSVSNPQMQQFVLSNALYSGGKTLKSELPDTLYAALTKLLAGSGINIEQMNMFKPWFVGSMITLVKLGSLGFDGELGIDKHFHGKAKTAGKKLDFLETPSFQIQLLSGISAKDQESMLAEGISECGSIEMEFEDIRTAWKEGNTIKMDALLNNSLKEFPSLYDNLLVKRNKLWTDKIEKYLSANSDSTDYLIIVGAAHIGGEYGLLNLLKQKGYIAEQF